MKFVSDLRLLLLGVWLGSAVFFVGVAQSAFAVMPTRELAGTIVNRTLSILNYEGLGIAVILILMSLIATKNANRILVWSERFLLLVVAAACAVNQFVVGLMLSSVRGQMGGRPIDEIAADDPLKIRFDNLHEYSVWILMAGMAAALLAFFLIANRKVTQAKSTTTSDPFDFSKEFKK